MNYELKTKNSKGAALILVLFTLAFVALFVVAFLDTITIDQQINTNQIRSLEANFIAEAGIETAVYELRQDSGYSGTGGDVTFPSGSGNTYNVTISGGDTISSVGTVGDFTRTIEAEYSLTGSSSPYSVMVDIWQELE